MKKTIWLLLIVVGFSCDSEIQEQNPNNSGATTQYYYLQFQVTCYNTTEASFNPVHLNVSVFDQKTRQRLIRGATYIRDGWFWTSMRFESNAQLRIELWNFNNGCIGWVKDINPLNNPNWFVTNIQQLHSDGSVDTFGHYHLGNCKNANDYDVDNRGVWGP